MGPEVIIGVICGIVALVVGSLVGWIGGITYRKRVAEAEIGSAEEKAKSIVANYQPLFATKEEYFAFADAMNVDNAYCNLKHTAEQVFRLMRACKMEECNE